MHDDTADFDPVALTLALWLGLILGVSGFVRLAHDAAVRNAERDARQVGTRLAQPTTPGEDLTLRFMTVGG